MGKGESSTEDLLIEYHQHETDVLYQLLLRQYTTGLWFRILTEWDLRERGEIEGENFFILILNF